MKRKNSKRIVENSISLIYIFNAEKNVVDSNQAGLDLLEYSRDELMKMNISDAKHFDRHFQTQAIGMPNELQHVLLNLYINASQSMPAGDSKGVEYGKN